MDHAYLGCGIYRKLQFRFLPEINRQAFHQQRCEPRTGSSTKRAKDQESLQTGTWVSHLADTVTDVVHMFLSDCVMATCIVVGSIFLTSNELLRMEKLTVRASADFI